MVSVVMIVHNVDVRPEILAMTKIALETMKATVDQSYQKVLIDNGSNDGGKTMALLSSFCNAEAGDCVIQFKRNEPVAHCWNVAIAFWAKGDVVVLVNNDVVFNKSGWLSALVDAARPEGVGAAGSRTLHWNGFKFLEGSFLAFRRQAASDIAKDGNIFDEQFDFTCEDVDFCERLSRNGKRLVEVPIEGMGYVTHAHHGTLSWMNEEGGWNGKSILDVMHESRRKLCRKFGKAERVDD